MAEADGEDPARRSNPSQDGRLWEVSRNLSGNLFFSWLIWISRGILVNLDSNLRSQREIMEGLIGKLYPSDDCSSSGPDAMERRHTKYGRIPAVFGRDAGY